MISGFRGDAIFMYVPETNICEPQTILEALENLFFVFADTLRQMIYNTTCTCRACRNMSVLDLKMVIHHGEYVIQKLGDREELLGADVIVPHRMLKNRVIEQTGIVSYALFSDAAAQASHLTKLAYPLVAHSEVYEHLGEVGMQVLDLRKVWEREQDKRRFVVAPEEAWLTFDWGPSPAPPLLEHIRPEEVQGLKMLLRELESHLRRKTPQMVEKDLEFHRAVYQTCRNRYLCEIIDFLRTKAHIVGYNAWSLPQRIEQSILEHREILRAIEEGHRARLEKLVVEHITFSKKSYQSQLKGLDQTNHGGKKPLSMPVRKKTKPEKSKERP